MKLTHTQKQALFEQGYVVVPDVVPRLLANQALRAINHALGEGLDAEQINRFRKHSYLPEVSTSAEITNLFYKTPAQMLVESVMGEGNLVPLQGGQIALRFPTLQDPPPTTAPHIDGYYSPDNGVPKGTIKSFTLLVGVLLHDLSGPDAGNLAVWPGTHRLIEGYFREHGPDALLHYYDKFGHDAPLAELLGTSLPEPVHVTGQAGDLIIAHYQLLHGVAPNRSPNIRYAIYFRMRHPEWQAQTLAAQTDIWMHCPGMRDVLPNRR